ncbi:hypothetical protein L1987_88117 [Smallanthus sonchifolius]|nr:hypothetical protein L1987_88117 [Smallanthus sonchifolius]
MIQPQTHLNVADNSGARELMCIRIIGASNRRYAHIGDVIVAVIKDAVPNMPLERSEVVRAVIVRTCKELKRDNGMIIRYDDNAAVVIDQEGNPKGTRVFGAIARELRQFNFTKIVSLAPEERSDVVLYEYCQEIESKLKNTIRNRKFQSTYFLLRNGFKIKVRSGKYENKSFSIPKKGSRGRIGSRKSIRKIPKGVIHIQASFNNTIVTVTDVRGRVVSWSSAGTCGFRGTRRGTPFAAQTAAANAIRAVVDQGMQRAEVMIKGPGLGRDAALRAIRRSGILLTFVRDVTPMPHNGCRPPKKRRV